MFFEPNILYLPKLPIKREALFNMQPLWKLATHKQDLKPIPAKQKGIQEEAIRPKEKWVFPRSVWNAILGQRPWGRRQETPVQAGTGNCWVFEEFLLGEHEFPQQTEWLGSWVARQRYRWAFCFDSSTLSDHISEDSGKDTSPL